MDKQILAKLSDFFEEYKSRTYPKGSILTFAHEDPEGIMWLQDGIIEQYDITPEGNKVTVNIFKPPAFFPMSWAINKTPNAFFYAALSEVTVKRADPEKVVTFVRANPDVMFDLLSRVYKGTDAILKRLVVMAGGIASNRLLFELLIEAYRFGTPMDDGRVLIRIKQEPLAARSGLARETISRELHKLAHDKAVELTSNGTIVNVEEIEKRLDFVV